MALLFVTGSNGSSGSYMFTDKYKWLYCLLLGQMDLYGLMSAQIIISFQSYSNNNANQSILLVPWSGQWQICTVLFWADEIMATGSLSRNVRHPLRTGTKN